MKKFELTRDYAKQLDYEDKLAKYKERFYINEGELYMDGNSCGLCSIDAEETLMEALNAWKNLGIGIWTKGGYFLYQDKLGGMMAPLINAEPQEVTCGNSCICQPKIRSKDHSILGHFLVNKCASENCTKAQSF